MGRVAVTLLGALLVWAVVTWAVSAVRCFRDGAEATVHVHELLTTVATPI